MIALVDCDGVLAMFVDRLCEGLAARGFKKTPDDIKHWELRHSFSDDEQRAMLDILNAPGFAASLAWYEGARDFLRQLKLEAETHIVTAPYETSDTWMAERKAWCSSELPRDRVHFIGGKNKHLMRGDVIIEDHPGTAAAWLDTNPNGIAVLIDRPWNRPGAHEWHMHQRMYRVRTFGEALSVIRECA